MAFYSFFYNCKNMDTKDYLAKERYPLSTQSLDFIQNQILFVQKIGALLGEGAWLLQEATAEKRGLVFVNQNGTCELVSLVVGSGFKYYWIERTIENEATTEVLMGANSYTPEPNQTLISSDGLKKSEDLWNTDRITLIDNYTNLTITRNRFSHLVVINGWVKMKGAPYNNFPIDIPELFRPKSKIFLNGLSVGTSNELTTTGVVPNPSILFISEDGGIRATYPNTINKQLDIHAPLNISFYN